ncbi:hypothetical protein FRC08_016990 [Ceratobasidium sp. 394]|nr:hypothetical protein FRC08_016990 [Ceratobasidium sp. 394]
MTTPIPDPPWTRNFFLSLNAACQVAGREADAEPGGPIPGVLVMRAMLLENVDRVDRLLAQYAYDGPLPCVDSCCGSPTPQPVVPVAHKSIATEPPVPNVESMDLDTPPPCPDTSVVMTRSQPPDRSRGLLT